MRSVILGLASISSLFVVGCARNAGTDSSASQAVDSSSSVESEGNVMMAAVDSSDMAVTALTSDQVAANIAAHVAARWQPASCASVAQPTSTSVVITLNDCTGPRGLVHVTGELDLSVSVSIVGVVTVNATATGLQVNHATLDIDATATYANHMLTVQTTGTGTGALGNAIDHTGDYTITWDPTSQCGSVSGTWSTTLTSTTGATAARSETANLMRCAGGCPTGSVVRDLIDGKTLTVTFDGSATASWTLSSGASGTVALGCQ